MKRISQYYSYMAMKHEHVYIDPTFWGTHYGSRKTSTDVKYGQ